MPRANSCSGSLRSHAVAFPARPGRRHRAVIQFDLSRARAGGSGSPAVANGSLNVSTGQTPAPNADAEHHRLKEYPGHRQWRPQADGGLHAGQGARQGRYAAADEDPGHVHLQLRKTAHHLDPVRLHAVQKDQVQQVAIVRGAPICRASASGVSKCRTQAGMISPRSWRALARSLKNMALW